MCVVLTDYAGAHDTYYTYTYYSFILLIVVLVSFMIITHGQGTHHSLAAIFSWPGDHRSVGPSDLQKKVAILWFRSITLWPPHSSITTNKPAFCLEEKRTRPSDAIQGPEKRKSTSFLIPWHFTDPTNRFPGEKQSANWLSMTIIISCSPTLQTMFLR